MGNTKSNNKIPAALCEPTYHIYNDTGAWDVALLKKLVLDGKLAPFYPPTSELPQLPDNQTTNNNLTTNPETNSITSSTNHPTSITTTIISNKNTSSRKRSTSSSTPDRKSSLLYKFQTILHAHQNNHEISSDNNNQLTENSNTSDSQPPLLLEEYYDECPICMMYYQGGMNVARCCSQRICSECVIQICKQGPKHAETSSVCPFCKGCPFKIDYKGPKPWSQRCREIEEEQAVLQLKIKHQLEEDKVQEEERRKRLEQQQQSNSHNNSTQHDVSILSNNTRNSNTNTSFTSNTSSTNYSLSNNNSFSSPTLSITTTPSSSHQVPPASGISFLETYFANRRINEMEESTNTTPTSNTNFSTTNQDNDSDTFYRYLFGSDRIPTSPTTRTLQNAIISRLQHNRFLTEEEDEEEEEEEDYLGYYLAGNRSPLSRRPAAGPISNHSLRAVNNEQQRNTTPSIPSSQYENQQSTEGLPTFSDFIPSSVDVTNLSADDEMLNEAIRLSLLEQGATTSESVILNFDMPILNVVNTSITTNNTITPSISPIIPSPITSSDFLTTLGRATSLDTNAASRVGDDENDEELQRVLRLSMLDK